MYIHIVLKPPLLSSPKENCWFCFFSTVQEVVSSNPTCVRDFFSFSVWAHFLSRAIAQKVAFGIFIQNFELPINISVKAASEPQSYFESGGADK